MFGSKPNLHFELEGNIAQGSIVIDKELVRFGDKFLDAMAISHRKQGNSKSVFHPIKNNTINIFLDLVIMYYRYIS
jgi:hypothetical protein